MVAISGDPSCPTVLERRRVELADPRLPGSKQPYHAAESLPLHEAETLISRCRVSTFALADSALAIPLLDLKKRGVDVVGCGLVMGSGRAVTDLPTILASHALIHTAEGDFFRNAITQASEKRGLPVTGLREKGAYDRAAMVLNTKFDELLQNLGAMGKSIAPWTQDEKLATLAAWMVLVASSRVTLVSEPARVARKAAS
jgi:hypothetical protein